MADNLGAASYRLVLDARQFNAGAVTSAKSMRDVNQVMRDTTTPAEKLAAKYDSVTAAYKRGEVPLKNYQRYLQQLNAEANRGVATFGTLKTRMAGIGGLGSGIGRGISTMAGAFGVGLGAYGAVSLTKSVIRDAESFNQAMQSSLAIMKDVNAEMRADMELTANRVAYQTKFSAEEAAQAYYFLASAGLDAQQSISAMPAVAQFAQAGMFDLSLATDLLTDAQSALGLTVKDSEQNLYNMSRVSDVLVKANTLANASVQQFSEALTNKSAAAIRMVNKDMEEGVAVLAAYADQGIKGAEAGTAFGIVMRDLQSKAIENAAAFKEHGVRVFDDAEKMRSLIDIVADLENALDGMTDANKKATLAALGFADKSIAYTQVLLGTSGKMRDYESALRDAAGVTQEVADKQIPALTKKMNELRATWGAFAQVEGNLLADQLLAANGNATMLAVTLASVLDLQMALSTGFGTIGNEIADAYLAMKDFELRVKWKAREILGLDPKEQEQRAMEFANQAQLEAALARRKIAAHERIAGESTPGSKFLADLKAMQAEFSIVGRIRKEQADAGKTDLAQAKTMLEVEKAKAAEAEKDAEAKKLAAEALREQRSLETELQRFRESLKSPAEKRMDELRQIGEWFDQGKISLEEYGKAFEAAFTKDFPPQTIEINYKINAPTEGEAFGSAESLRNLYTSRLGLNAPLSTASNINFETGQEEAMVKGIGGGKSKTDELLDSINASIEAVEINTRSIARDPGRVKVAGSLS